MTGKVPLPADTSGICTLLKWSGMRLVLQFWAHCQAVSLPGLPPFQVAVIWALAAQQLRQMTRVDIVFIFLF
jgi:hypothetical protein